MFGYRKFIGGRGWNVYMDDGGGGDGGGGDGGGDDGGGSDAGGSDEGGEAGDGAGSDEGGSEAGDEGGTGVGSGPDGADGADGSEGGDTGDGSGPDTGSQLFSSDNFSDTQIAALKSQGRYITYSDRSPEDAARARAADDAFIDMLRSGPSNSITDRVSNTGVNLFYGGGFLDYIAATAEAEMASRSAPRQKNPGTEPVRVFRDGQAFKDNPNFTYAGGFGTLYGNNAYMGM